METTNNQEVHVQVENKNKKSHRALNVFKWIGSATDIALESMGKVGVAFAKFGGGIIIGTIALSLITKNKEQGE